ncbi:TPA: hypothetical protein N0F65_006174 [Lagenidium giganteum]|uniref:Uncharacterized protein n=1 Tax=Lagenidium giganteum TaxID=4803 RepID=A0AAV2Z9W1_9STRA|nr:TPA: hypothetical protein N0F65_006174 [Lagenidium giganteum]
MEMHRESSQRSNCCCDSVQILTRFKLLGSETALGNAMFAMCRADGRSKSIFPTGAQRYREVMLFDADTD